MGYVGNSPALKYASFAVQHFTTSATTGYTLDHAVTNENGIALFINNVRQEPGSSYAYTAAGTTLTLSAATTSSDTMYCVFIGKAVQTVVPPDGSVDSAQLATDAVTTVKITDTNVTGAKLNDDVISGQGALGAAPADTDEFLVSDAGVLKRVDYSYIKGITASSFLPTAAPLIINGDMAIAQRGTSVTGKTNGDSGYYTVDRIQFAESGTMTAVITNTQESLSSGNAFNNGFEKAYKIDVTTADASAASDILHRIKYNLEAQDVQAFKFGKTDAQPMTLAFWVKATKTGTNTVHMERGDSARSCAQEYTVSSTDTWEHKVLNFPADTTGNMPYDNGEGLNIQWNLVAGTDYTSGTLCTTWEAFNKPDTAVGQVNNFDSTSNNFHITGIQLEVGTYTSADLPPFRFESYADNLRRCQRYYTKWLGANGDGSGSYNVSAEANGTSALSSINFFTPVPLRATPTINNPVMGYLDYNTATSLTSGGTVSCVAAGEGGMSNVIFNATGAANLTDGTTATARAYDDLTMSSEL